MKKKSKKPSNVLVVAVCAFMIVSCVLGVMSTFVYFPYCGVFMYMFLSFSAIVIIAIAEGTEKR